jgi:hypothetical protein
MNVELFWTAVAVIAVWELVSLIRIELIEWVAMRKFDKWAEHVEDMRVPEITIKKVVKKK